MAVLCASVITKSGKTLLARAFRSLTRTRIEALLGAFPNLIGAGKQHTFVETGNVRYVYQPLDTLYLILITTRTSNMIEDIDTLGLLHSILSHFNPSLTEEGVTDNAYDILFAFDEAISMGYRENVKLDQILTFLEMDSNTEKMEKMLEKERMANAKKQMEQAAQKLSQLKAEGKTSFRGGISSQDQMSSSGIVDLSNQFDNTSISGASSGMGGFHTAGTAPSRGKATKPKSGMKLKGSQRTTSTVLQDLVQSGDIEEEVAETTVNEMSPRMEDMITEGVHITIKEKLQASLNKESDLESVEVKGELVLVASDESHGDIRIQLKQGRNQDFKFTPNHKYLNKKQFSSSDVLSLKKNQSFPSRTSVQALRWHLPKPDDSVVPISLSLFVETSEDSVEVFLEYNLQNEDKEVQNVKIGIPLSGMTPNVNEIDGNYEHDVNNDQIIWTIDSIDQDNAEGNLSFTVSEGEHEDFYPITLSYEQEELMSNIAVADVASAESGKSVKHEVTSKFQGIETFQ
eukprot:gb/GECH01012569.1/.p1 GENE.gb/GECH01012569.1/~~gb/GECH01012569.1/.p1  ORF type:complete len:515 (+),score=148.51 gb/GECH01012569.1/:1-1545(+)